MIWQTVLCQLQNDPFLGWSPVIAQKIRDNGGDWAIASNWGATPSFDALNGQGFNAILLLGNIDTNVFNAAEIADLDFQIDDQNISLPFESKEEVFLNWTKTTPWTDLAPNIRNKLTGAGFVVPTGEPTIYDVLKVIIDQQ